MKNTLSMGLVGLFLCAFALANGAFAEIVTLPLNCAGDYNVNTPRWTTNFDLGVTFSEISHVYIDWSGEIYGRLGQGIEYPEPTPGYGILEAYIGAYPDYPPLRIAFSDVYGGMSTYPSPEPFDVRSKFLLYGYGPGVTWNDLLDGKETITIYYPSIVSTANIIDDGSAVLNDATLVVDGTIIPEPATFVLLGLGFLQIFRRKNHNHRNFPAY
jgi:hypothetical protein